MGTVNDLDEVIKRCQFALDEFARGNPKPMQGMFSHKEKTSAWQTHSVLPRMDGSRSLRPWTVPH
jgi:hypothetical protein